MGCSAGHWTPRSGGLPARLRSTACPIGSAATTAGRLPASGSAGCRAWPSGGCGSGIVPERIAPGRPDQNGSHEQFHAVLKADTARPPAAHLRAQQRRFAAFLRRIQSRAAARSVGRCDARDLLHAVAARAARDRCPRSCIPGIWKSVASPRVGSISWRRPVFLTESLAGERVAFEEVDDGLWTVYFGTVPLARFDERLGQIHPLATITTGARADKSARASLGKSRMQNPNKLLPMSPD